MDELSRDDRRALLAMWCQVAWADGKIEDAERDFIHAMWEEMGKDVVSGTELAAWIAEGPSFSPAEASPQTRRLFVRKALELARADGQADVEEVDTIRAMRAALCRTSEG